MKKKYPSSGDSGRSKIFTGEFVGKEHSLFEAVGTLDELNSVIGWARCVCEDEELGVWLERIQRRLFDAGGIVGRWSGCDISEEAIVELEEQISLMQSKLPRMAGFILPGGVEFASRLHIARTVTRRAERRISAAIANDDERRRFANSLRFINRLSDWFYVAACFVNSSAGVGELHWRGEDVEE